MAQEEKHDELITWIKEASENNRCIWNLSHHNLRSLPEEFYLLTSLNVLHLHNNLLTSLSSKIRLLTNLQLLDVSSNELKEIPAEIDSLHNLKSLILHNNKISHIPYTISNLTSLEILSLSCNQLSFVPYDLGSCTRLVSLSLSHNRIAALPQIFHQLSNLTELNVSQNRIQQLVSLPTSLTILNLSGNELTSLPASLNLLTDLKFLGLEGNKFKAPSHEETKTNPIKELVSPRSPRTVRPQVVNPRTAKKNDAQEDPRKLLITKMENTNLKRLTNMSISEMFNEPSIQELNKEQFQQILENSKILPEHNEELIETLFHNFDDDNSGTVNKRELMKGLFILKSGTLEEKLKFGFNLYDVNHDGKISKGEIENMLKSITTSMESKTRRKYDAKGLDQFIHNFVTTTFYLSNKDSDEGLTFNEFVQAAKNDETVSQFFTLDVINKHQ